MSNDKLWTYLYALPQPFMLILFWHLLFSCGIFNFLVLDLRWALQLTIMLCSLLGQLYLSYKAAHYMNGQRFWLLCALGLPLSLFLVDVGSYCSGVWLASFGGMNEMLPSGQLVQLLWLFLLLGYGVVWLSVKEI